MYVWMDGWMVVCMFVCSFVHVSAVPTEARRGHQIPRTKVTDDCEQPCFRNPSLFLNNSTKCS